MSPLSIWALAFGAIIGWGAFVMPGLRFLPGSGPLGAVIGFVAGGIMLMFVALAYGRLVGSFPIAGGVFAFAYAAFGPTLSFICGWALVLGYLSIIALNATAIVLLTRFLMPGLLEFGHMYTIVDWHIYAGELILLEAVLVLFWFFLLMPEVLKVLLGLDHPVMIGADMTAIITFVLFEAAYFAEIMRAGIQSVSKGQMSAAMALGLRYGQTMRYVILPQAVRNMLPVLLTQTIILFQDTSLVYVISGNDFMGAVSKIAQRDGQLVLMYSFAAVCYLTVSVSLSMLVRRLQRKIAVAAR